MKSAAGVLFIHDASGDILLMRRQGSDHAGAWSFPGGHIEGDETAEQAARREGTEETGYDVYGQEPLESWTRRQTEEVDFTTHIHHVKDKFRPKLNAEHDAFCWTPRAYALDAMDLHPGAKIALRRFDMDELDVARAIREGELTSPQRYGPNLMLVALRITGTGQSYRPAVNEGEHVWRDPSVYLNPDFLERCQGLIVTLRHPDSNVLTSDEFHERAIGSIMLPYIMNDEVWGVARIYDAEAIGLIEKHELTTSPGVLTGGKKFRMGDGKTLLVEGKPLLLDSLALLGPGEPGVWDKGGPLSGVESAVAADCAYDNKLDAALDSIQGWRDKNIARRMST